MLGSLHTRWKLSRLIREWLEFRQLYDRSLGAKNVPDSEEARFLRLKASIAKKMPLLESGVPAEVAPKAAKHRRGMSEMLGGVVALRSERDVPTEERDEMIRQWHAHYLFLNELRGVTLGARPAPSPISASPSRPKPPVPTGMPVFRAHPFRRAHTSPLRTIVGGVALFLIGYLIVVMVGVRLQRQWAGVERYGATSRKIWEMLPKQVETFFEPVVTSYGVEVTIGLLGILLFSLGYWVFIRGR